MLKIKTTLEIPRGESFDFGPVRVELDKDWDGRLAINIEEESLAQSLNASEARDLVEALAAQFGTDVFEGVAQSVIDEYSEAAE